MKEPTREDLCRVIRKYEIDFARASEMSDEDRELVEWAIRVDDAINEDIERDGTFEGDLV